MLLQDAYDTIDIYGTDKKRWPPSEVAHIEELLASDEDFSAYFDEMRQIDEGLENWNESEDDDGARVQDDDVDPYAQNDAEPNDDEITPGTSLVGSEDDQEMGLDLDAVKDIDETLNEVLEGLIADAFGDRHQVCFTKDYDVIAPYDDRGGVEPNVKAVEDELRPTIAPMQKELQRLIVARSHAILTPGFRRGRLNPAALHRAPTGDDRLFRRKQSAITNKVALSLVIDNSGSMSGRNYDARIKVAMKAAWAFAETLDRLKIPCDVVGFTNKDYPAGTNGQRIHKEAEEFSKKVGVPLGAVRLNPFYMPIYKGFDEKFGPAQKRRMAHLMENQKILRSNNDALALEYAGKRLLARPEPRKIMIVFSDGQPADIFDGSVLNRTVKDNVKKLEAAGIETIGVGIQSASVKSFYPKNYVLQQVSTLPQFVMGQLKTLLT